jgi:RimJ/RimL family protein N-acetyltransferase
MKPLSGDKAKIMFNQLLNEQNGVYFSIIKKDNEGIIGYVLLAHILKSHKVAREFGIVIGDKKLWGHGYGSEATKLILEYGFKNLKLHRIELLVLDSNERARTPIIPH